MRPAELEKLIDGHSVFEISEQCFSELTGENVTALTAALCIEIKVSRFGIDPAFYCSVLHKLVLSSRLVPAAFPLSVIIIPRKPYKLNEKVA